MDARFTPDIVEAAKQTQRDYCVPASVSMAQWACESAYGKAEPAGSNNDFGIKAAPGQASVVAMTHEFINGRDIVEPQRFAHYATHAEGFEAHGKLLTTNKRYAPAMKAWLRGDLVGGVVLMAKVYATAPNYGTTLLSIINANGLSVIDRQVALEGSPKIAAVKAATVAVAKVAAPAALGATATGSAITATGGHPSASLILGGVSIAAAVASWALHRSPAAPIPAAAVPPATPIVPAPTADSALGPVIDAPAPAPAVADEAPFATAPKGPTMSSSSPLSTIGAFCKGVATKLEAAHVMTANGSDLAQGVIKSLPDLPAAAKAVTALVVDVETGHYGKAPTDAIAAVEDFDKIVANFGIDTTALDNFVKALPFAPAIAA